jgi:hypothetical protein
VRLLAHPKRIGVFLANAGGEPFEIMSKVIFQPEYGTEVFVNGNNGITVTQDDLSGDAMVVFNSKKRAIEVARAILSAAKIATFEAPKEDEE